MLSVSYVTDRFFLKLISAIKSSQFSYNNIRMFFMEPFNVQMCF